MQKVLPVLVVFAFAGHVTALCQSPSTRSDARILPASGSTLRIDEPRCEYLRNPPAIDAPRPRLSWSLQSEQRGQKQTAYRVLVASTLELLANDVGDLWDSGKVASDQSAQVVYAGKTLASRMRCFWKVQAWDKDGKPSAWSPPMTWSMGLLKPEDWRARWIRFGKEPSASAPAALQPMNNESVSSSPWMRKTFVLDAKPEARTGLRQCAGLLRALCQRPQGRRRRAQSGGFVLPIEIVLCDL